jgi:hypothetical protein
MESGASPRATALSAAAPATRRVRPKSMRTTARNGRTARILRRLPMPPTGWPASLSTWPSGVRWIPTVCSVVAAGSGAWPRVRHQVSVLLSIADPSVSPRHRDHEGVRRGRQRLRGPQAGDGDAQLLGQGGVAPVVVAGPLLQAQPRRGRGRIGDVHAPSSINHRADDLVWSDQAGSHHLPIGTDSGAHAASQPAGEALVADVQGRPQDVGRILVGAGRAVQAGRRTVGPSRKLDRSKYPKQSEQGKQPEAARSRVSERGVDMGGGWPCALR